MKKLASLIFSVVAGISVTTIAFAGTWMQNETGWWYQNDDGTYPANTWIQDFDGAYYYFNENGYMLANTTAPDGKAVGSDGAWVDLVAGDTKTMLNEISNWLISDIWNNGFCDFYHYEETGTGSLGQILDTDFSLSLFKEAYKKKAGYEAYINGLPDGEYSTLKMAWGKLSAEADRLYEHYKNGIEYTGTPANTALFVQYRIAFTSEASK